MRLLAFSGRVGATRNRQQRGTNRASHFTRAGLLVRLMRQLSTIHDVKKYHAGSKGGWGDGRGARVHAPGGSLVSLMLFCSSEMGSGASRSGGGSADRNSRKSGCAPSASLSTYTRARAQNTASVCKQGRKGVHKLGCQLMDLPLCARMRTCAGMHWDMHGRMARSSAHACTGGSHT